MSAAAATLARVSSSTPTSLKPLSLRKAPLRDVLPNWNARGRRPSPLIRIARPSLRLPLSTVPTSLFPDATAWPCRRGWFFGRDTPRFILVPNPEHRQQAITVLDPPSGMLCYVQIVSTPTADTPGGCLMLHFDNRRYLFGRLAEGTQRTMVQRQVSLAKISDIFLSGRIDWHTTGGLLGMILTLADLKATSVAALEEVNEERRSKGKKAKDLKSSFAAHLNIHGGKNLVHMLATARPFILRKALPVYPRELRHDPRSGEKEAGPDYEDENIRVWSIPVSNETSDAAGTSEPRSPKKRKLSPSSDTDAGAGSSEEADQAIREAVVRDMFCSKWNLDTLREMPLREVQLPAKIFIRNDQGHLEQYQGPDAESAPDPNMKVFVRLPWPASKVQHLPSTEPSRASMCYVVKCHPRRGKFNVEAARELGVEKVNFKLLTAGQSVPGKDGITVTPDMVLGATLEGHGFAVVDIPFPEVIDDLVSRHEWSNPEIMNGIDTMYWILSESISLEDPRLHQFIQARPSIKHIVLGPDMCPNLLALESPASQLIKMNRVDEQRFPFPVFDAKPPTDVNRELGAVAEPARSGLKFQLAPKQGFLTDRVVPLMDTGKPIWELATHTPQVLQLANTARQTISKPEFLAEVETSQRDLPSPETEIIPLGTGSAMPSKYRNVSAILVRVPGWGSYLFDCGENTLGQLRRSFGFQGADDVLRDLRAIYISHAHADHHLGTINVVDRWSQVSDGKLAIIASPRYQSFVREFQSVQPLRGSNNRLVHANLRPAAAGSSAKPGTLAKAYFNDADFDDDPTFPTSLPRIEAVYVDHCYEATAGVLTFPDTGLKIAYSGDCRPSTPFAELGRGAHLLIHECTFEDELAGDAHAKKHSTLSDAIRVGREMQARRILLTHFSQRYPKLPVIDEAKLVGSNDDGEDGEDGERGKTERRDVEVLFAFDMMRVKLGEFKQAKQFLPALRELLKVEEPEQADEE
ncbi:uncharacterized protein B0T15DRAFT_310298 [Chaetomium strumarium]|uniref:ribonuclease Z n=1 Tax=Chaetomium strumarium TaxID=1170767 RepID=A0AAJ0GMA2_9PEZI|nr:hypothetical protein B0T15DRAFT_310298 [Chaetomium strumarium]